MEQLTLEVNDELAARIRPIRFWLPYIVELSLIGFKTLATRTSTEVIQFLSNDPTPDELIKYHISESSQERMQRLLALNKAGMLSESENLELDELQKIEHFVILLKTRVIKKLKKES